MAARATIVEVAAALGVSPSTVSRAFNHPRKLLPETVERVRAAAAELGYVPNRAARALSTGRPATIGLTVPDITNPFFPPMVRAAQREAERHELDVFVAETDQDPARELRLIERLRPQVRGLVLASSRLDEDVLRATAASFPVVLVNRDVPGLARVLLAASDPLERAVAGFAAAGVRSFCYVGGPRRSWSELERRTAVQRAVARHGAELTVLRANRGTFEAAQRVVDDIVECGAGAVVAFDDVIALAVLAGLTARGVRVPEDVKLLGCDDALPIVSDPPLSTVRLRAAKGMRRAIQMLSAADGPVPEQRVELHGEVLHRGTT